MFCGFKSNLKMCSMHMTKTLNDLYTCVLHNFSMFNENYQNLYLLHKYDILRIRTSDVAL